MSEPQIKTGTETPLHDTWEFNGTNWTQILTDGPAVNKAILEYDPVRNQTIMLEMAGALAGQRACST